MKSFDFIDRIVGPTWKTVNYFHNIMCINFIKFKVYIILMIVKIIVIAMGVIRGGEVSWKKSLEVLAIIRVSSITLPDWSIRTKVFQSKNFDSKFSRFG